MRPPILTAIAAATLTFTTPAAADTTIFQESGNGVVYYDRFFTPVDLPDGAGRYRIDFAASIPVLIQLSAGYTVHWDIFKGPPPKPHSEFLAGNQNDYETGPSSVGDSEVSWIFTVPETLYTFFDSGLGAYGTPPGTPLYREDKYERPFVRLYVDDAVNSSPFDFDFTVTQLDRPAAIPEPATWSLLIAGFGALGLALRQRRLSQSAARDRSA
jgi:hypothetical protein